MAEIETWLEKAANRRPLPNRPLVSLAYAQSLDGSISIERGQRTELSGQISNQLTHKIRSAHDGILVGVGTVLADNPLLTARVPDGKHPQPIILDTHLRTPPQARLLAENPKPTWIACCEPLDPNRQASLEMQAAILLRLPADPSGGVSLTALLDCLGGMGIQRLMVEGGAGIISSFLTQGLVDLIVITVAPLFLGGLRAFAQNAKAGLKVPPFLRLTEVEYQRMADDLVIFGLLR
jgi:riboflavin-specific deaminase-like protein